MDAKSADHKLFHSEYAPWTWSDLNFWSSGEWQVCDENLKDLEKHHVEWNPGRSNMFRALDLTSFDQCRVVFCGQDPYPNPGHATGLSFSVPPDLTVLPPSLGNILTELQEDIGNITINNGDLSRWARKEGVLLWNAVPACQAWKSKSCLWPEWEELNAEMFKRLSDKHVVFAFLGGTAAYYRKFVNEEKSDVIHVTHPSPLAQKNTTKPFKGCRLFSRINDSLDQLGWKPVDWRLQ